MTHTVKFSRQLEVEAGEVGGGALNIENHGSALNCDNDYLVIYWCCDNTVLTLVPPERIWIFTREEFPPRSVLRR